MVKFRNQCLTSYRSYDDLEKNSKVIGTVIDLIKKPERSAPVMLVKFGKELVYLPAPLGVRVGSFIEAGSTALVNPGNVLPVSMIPEGVSISNIELKPGDGGKFVRSAGSSASVLFKEEGKVMIQLPSKRSVKVLPECRATIGVIAGGGVKEKPIGKAGKSYYINKAKSKIWPRVHGVAKNACEHPFGGGGRRGKICKSTPRNAPPGRKVGSIASKRSGRKKR